jgi:cytochrome c-type biogenesis protein CcmH/NrfF
VGIRRAWNEDLYVIMAGIDDANAVLQGTNPRPLTTFRVLVNPLVPWIWLVLLATPLAGQVAVPPLTPQQEETAVAAMERLRSPVTPFHTVDMCPSVQPLRDSIRVAAAEGMSTDQIVEDVVARYGEEIRLLPKRSGVGLLAWIATPILLLVGAGLVAARLRRGQAVAAEEAEVEEEITDEERARLTAALHDWKRSGEVKS